MIKQKQINKAIQWGTVGAMAYFIGSAIAGAIKRKREQGTSGIGWAQAYASRNRLAPYFNGDYLISKVVVDLTGRKGTYADVTIYFYGRMPIGYWVSMEDVKWLAELCERLGEDIVFYE